jgi:hypothetical protein
MRLRALSLPLALAASAPVFAQAPHCAGFAAQAPVGFTLQSEVIAGNPEDAASFTCR